MSVEAAAEPAHALARSRGLVLTVILTIQLMMVLDTSIVNIALPQIQAALHFSATDLSWVINAYTLAFGGVLLLGARAGDILGRRRVLVIGVAVFTVASLIGGLAQSSEVLLVARTCQGIGAALASPSALALLMVTYPSGRERLKAISYYSGVSIGGTALGLIVGGLLTEWASWRWVFFVNVPFGVALVAVGALILRETPRHVARLDLSGGLTSTLGMTALVYAFVQAPASGWSSPVTIAAFAVGGGLMAVFILIETRASSPLVPLRILADRNRASCLVARLMLIAGTTGMLFFMTQFLQEVRGYSPAQTGVAFVPLMASLMLTAQLARFISERLPAVPLIIVGIVATALGNFLLSGVHENTGYPVLLVAMLLCGGGSGLVFVPISMATMDGVPAADAGAVSGLINTMQQIGSALGLAVLVTVFGAARNGAAPISGSTVAQARHAFVVGVRQSFLIAAAILVVCAVMVAFTIRIRRSARPVSAGELGTAQLDLA